MKLLEVDVQRDVDQTTAVLRGEVDLSTSVQLQQTFDALAAEGAGRVVLDLRGLTFLDCSGLRRILALKEAIGDRLVLIRGDRSVQVVFDLTGTGALFETVDAPPLTLAA